MPFTGPIEDRVAIRETIDAYSDAVVRHDPEAWIANWCDDGEWRLPGINVAGKDQIKAAWSQAMKQFSLAAFFASPGSIEVIGGRAEARVLTQEVLVDQAGAVRRIIGAYDDVLEKREGRWLFLSRTYRILRDET